MIPDLAVDALAAYRLTKLVTDDTITQPSRERLIAWAYRNEGIDAGGEPGDWDELAQSDRGAPKLAVLVSCRWCAGMWLAAGVVLARLAFPRRWDPLARALALSAAAALLAGLEEH